MVEQTSTELTPAETQTLRQMANGQAGPVEHHTTVIREGGGSSGMGWVFALLFIAALAFGGFYLMNQTKQSDSVSNAAGQVGDAAEKVGNAAEKAADKLTGNK